MIFFVYFNPHFSFMKQLNPLLVGTWIILLSVNLFVIFQYDLAERRWLRVISSGIFLLIFFTQVKNTGRYLKMAFLLLFLADLLVLGFEYSGFSTIFMIFMIAAYACLFLYVRPFIKDLKVNYFQNPLPVAIVLINIILLFFLKDMAGEKLDGYFYSFIFLLYGLTIIFLLFIAFSLNNRYSNQASFFFICAILGFMFCEISAFIAYYLDIPEFYLSHRFFYLAGLACLVNFAGLEKEAGMMKKMELL